MSRRRSSLVVNYLGNISTNYDVARPDSTTTVIEIENNWEINSEDPTSESTERIFQIVLDDLSHYGRNLNQPENAQIGVCQKVINWFHCCKAGCTCQLSWIKISEYLRKKQKQLNEKLQKGCEKSYLESYFLYANICGVSPFRIGKDNQQVVWLKKVPYYVINTLTALDTVRMAKRFVLSMIVAKNEKSADIQLYLFNSLIGATVLLRTGFFLSLKFHPEKYMKAVQAVCVSSYRNHLYTVKVAIESLMVCGSSLCIILLSTHIGLLYGTETYIIGNAKNALSLLCPRPFCDELQLDLDVLSPLTVTLGLLGWAIKLAGTLFDQIACDGILFSALTLGKSANAFKFTERVNNASLESAVRVGADINTKYKDIKQISKLISSAFNVVFRFFLLGNIFMFAVFIDEWFDPSYPKAAKFVRLVNVACVVVTFYYANQAAKTGDRFREWMKREENRNILGMSQLDVLMENSSPNSIGYGRGALFIYDSTLIGFTSVVAAYFLGIVETRPQDTGQGEIEYLCPWKNGSTFLWTP